MPKIIMETSLIAHYSLEIKSLPENASCSLSLRLVGKEIGSLFSTTFLFTLMLAMCA